MHMSLQTRLLFLATVGTVVVLLVFGGAGVLAVRDNVDQILQSRLTLAQAIAQRLDYVLAQNLDTLQGVAFSQQLDIEDTNMEPEKRALHEAYLHTIFGDSVYILDKNGQVVWGEPRPPAPLGVSLLSYAHVRNALDKGKPVVSDIYQTLDTNRPVISVVIPLRNIDGNLVGLIGGDADPTDQRLQQVARPVGLGDTGYVDVVDRNGLVLASSRVEQVLRESDHSNKVSSLISEGRSVVGTCHACHDTARKPERAAEVMGFAPLTMAPWGVMVRQSESEALAASFRLRNELLLFGIPLFLLALLLARGIAQSIVRPITSLTRAAGIIAAGTLDDSIAAMGEDEIGRLAASLEAMRQKLKDSVEGIQRWNQELGERVRKRTQELEQSRSELLRRNADLSMLNAVARALSTSLQVDKLLREALTQIKQSLGADAGAICVSTDDVRQRQSIHSGCTRDEAEALAAAIDSSMANREGAFLLVGPGSGATGWVQDVRAIMQPAGLQALAAARLVSKGKSLGTLWLGSRSSDGLMHTKAELIAALAAQICMVVENAILYEEIHAKEAARGELLHKVISAQEEERKRLARELHDDTSQALAALGLALETIMVAPALSADEVKHKLAGVKTMSVCILEDVHKLIFDLRPSLLDDLGLVAALQWYAESRLESQGVRVMIETTGEEQRLPAQIETALFRVVQEALNNVARHADAKNTDVSISFKSDSVVVEIADDGKGFDPQEARASAESSRGLGLMGMEERVSLLNGRLEISSKLDEGTYIRIEVPIPREAEQHERYTGAYSR